MKRVLTYVLLFVLTVFICLAALVFATFASQPRIDQNIIDSLDGLNMEGPYRAIQDGSDSAVLDNYTDAIILAQSKGMVSDSKSTVLTNPMYSYGEDPVDSLIKYAWMVKPVPTSYYTRYWMGFRAITRWLLTFLNYFQIRRYVGISIFVLLFTLMNSISKRLGTRQSMVFALCILSIRPHVISSSLQYSCCFLIAFLAMLVVPWLHKNPKFQGLFFMEVGMLTMYFDFYTVPLVTFGLPMIYLCLLQVNENSKNYSGKIILRNVFVWLTGYIGMWVSKLFLTDLLTDKSGITSAVSSVTYRLGLSGERLTNKEYYSPAKALNRVWEVLLPDQEAVVIFWAIMAVLLVFIVWKCFRKEIDIAKAKNSVGILGIGILPIIWFCVTAQPIIIHALFQYRSVVVLFWAVSAYLCLIMGNKNASEIPG